MIPFLRSKHTHPPRTQLIQALLECHKITKTIWVRRGPRTHLHEGHLPIGQWAGASISEETERLLLSSQTWPVISGPRHCKFLPYLQPPLWCCVWNTHILYSIFIIAYVIESHARGARGGSVTWKIQWRWKSQCVSTVSEIGRATGVKAWDLKYIYAALMHLDFDAIFSMEKWEL